eukprot:scaffold2293_cov333-Pavlova_lutheri.AAC.1
MSCSGFALLPRSVLASLRPSRAAMASRARLRSTCTSSSTWQHAFHACLVGGLAYRKPLHASPWDPSFFSDTSRWCSRLCFTCRTVPRAIRSVLQGSNMRHDGERFEETKHEMAPMRPSPSSPPQPLNLAINFMDRGSLRGRKLRFASA